MKDMLVVLEKNILIFLTMITVREELRFYIMYMHLLMVVCIPLGFERFPEGS